SLKFANKQWAKNGIWAFSAFVGYCFLIDENSTGDAFVYRYSFYYFIQNEYDYSRLFSSLFEYSSEIEFVERFISITVGQFTDNYHFLFFAYGLFFGYFFSRN